MTFVLIVAFIISLVILAIVDAVHIHEDTGSTKYDYERNDEK
jgi:hypothetical protein